MTLLSQQKATGFITIASGVAALVSMAFAMISVGFDSKALADPMLMLGLPKLNVAAARWSMVFDMLGYYLLLLPAIALFYDWMKNRTAWNRIIAFCGLAYVLIGSMGASILAAVWPHLLGGYATATPELQNTIKENFTLINGLVYGGLWNMLELIFAAAWWLGVGAMLYRQGFRGWGIVTVLTGLSCAANTCGMIFQSPALHEAGLNTYLLLAIVWAIVTGVSLLKKPLHAAGEKAQQKPWATESKAA